MNRIQRKQVLGKTIGTCGTLTSRAHAREKGGCETVRKPEGSEKDPREGCLYLRIREQAKRQKAKQTLERER
jgi:hypothetical protein